MRSHSLALKGGQSRSTDSQGAVEAGKKVVIIVYHYEPKWQARIQSGIIRLEQSLRNFG